MAEHVGQNPLLKLEALGQSVWLDFMRRGMFARVSSSGSSTRTG